MVDRRQQYVLAYLPITLSNTDIILIEADLTAWLRDFSVNVMDLNYKIMSAKVLNLSLRGFHH